jgi:hypothetical protein
MHVQATEPTRLVRIVYDDGSSVECPMNPALAASIARMTRAERRANKVYRKNVKLATDIKAHPESWWQTKRFVAPRAPKPGVQYFGEGAVWVGPAAQWLTAEGQVCHPGEEPEVNELGRIVGRRHGQRCRFCSHLLDFPANGVCYNSECIRERRGKLG